ncbi:tetratricopeptide repeat-containing sensor histidine kinase [Pedobacter sp. UBA5917]|jgi:signal transduction histidine kinase|uniref:tetratricopeptide repeat-containing sensor histidine kinase n=1 Tax=Pedobacter sp. UBA5917 TaxID=1947061 RepID=UPI0025F80E35|nr:ATP-binding protein [Pedobacter sp. UBA5917]
MRKLFLVCLFLAGSYMYTFAQLSVTDKRYPDSLVKLTKSTSSDSIKARAFFKLSYHWAEIDSVKSKHYLIESLKYGSKYPYLKAVYYYYLAAYNTPINTQKSEFYYMEADKQLSKFNTKEAFFIRAKAWGNYATLQQLKDDELLMVDILLNKCIPLIKKAGNDEYLGKYYHDLALVFGNQKQYGKAEEYFKLAISIFKRAKLIDVNRLLKTYAIASKNYLNNNKIESAKITLHSAKLILKESNDPRAYVEYYLAYAMYNRKIKAFVEALQNIKNGLSYAIQITNPYPTEKLYFEKYKILTDQGDYKNAIAVIENILKKPASKFSVNTLIYYSDLANLYGKLGNSKMAYNWLAKYVALNDSLTKQDVLRRINQIEIKFKTAENQKKIAALNMANQKANLSAKNSRLLNWLLGVVSLLILSVSIFAVYYYRNQKKLAAQREEIRLRNAMLQGQEVERYRVARDLHDGLGNVLAVVKFNLWQFAKEKPAAELDEITHQLDHSINELRRIAHGMMPEMLLNIGLEAAVKDLCESLTSDNLEIDCQLINIKNTIPQQTQVSIYRIIQELLTNVVKHAQAKNVLLQCTQHKNIFFITLEDDGRGFNNDQQKGKAGIGLNNIKSRVAYLNGKIEIGTRISQPGTSINIELNVKV